MTDDYYIIAVSDNGLVVGGKVEAGNMDITLIPCDDNFRANDNQGDSNDAKASAAQNVLAAIMPDTDDEDDLRNHDEAELDRLEQEGLIGPDGSES